MSHRLSRQDGATIIEVLVAVILVVVGLLGLAGLQSRVSLAQVEAFQRAQAIVLVQDMASRINANRRNVGSYVTGTGMPKGTDVGAQSCSGLTGAALDLCEWNNELVGAGETSGTSNVGAMLGARGCVESVQNTMPYQVRVSVVWQGTVGTVAPASTTCGSGKYTDDTTRRAITATVEIGCLQNDPASTLCISGIPAF
jgi:type IV pilus assembly protein PilV